MTQAERKRRSREQLQKSGYAEFGLRLRGEKLKMLEKLAEASGMTRGEVLEMTVDLMLTRIQIMLTGLHKLAKDGASDDVLRAFVRKAMSPSVLAKSAQQGGEKAK